MRYANAQNLSVLFECISKPRFLFRVLKRNCIGIDRRIYGTLPETSLEAIVPNSENLTLELNNAFDRTAGTSISLEELCCLLAIAKHLKPKRILEIGTWNGNTSLNLAANTDATIVTMDLPPDFRAEEDRVSLLYPKAKLNLTGRKELGRQFKGDRLGSRIHQVYGDSARIDWGQLEGPFGLIFIDGCHDYSYVQSDTKNALAHVENGGAICWHDYRMIADVSRVVDEVARNARDLQVYAIEETRLAVAFKTNPAV